MTPYPSTIIPENFLKGQTIYHELTVSKWQNPTIHQTPDLMLNTTILLYTLERDRQYI
jgi:hypothetical protein